MKFFLWDPVREIIAGRHVHGFIESLVSGGIAALGSIIGGNMAADATTEAAGMSIDEQRRQFDIARQDIAPYREAGVTALNQIMALLGLTPPPSGAPDTGISTDQEALDYIIGRLPSGHRLTTRLAQQLAKQLALAAPAAPAEPGPAPTAPDFSAFFNTPDYQFTLQQGEQAVKRNLAATGDLMSGEAGKALLTFGQGLASQKFTDYYNRLAGLAGTGATQTANLNAMGANVAGNIGNTLMAAGAGRASSYLNTGNAIADFATGAGNNYMFQQLLNRFAPQTIVPVAQQMNPGWGSGAFSYAPD